MRREEIFPGVQKGYAPSDEVSLPFSRKRKARGGVIMSAAQVRAGASRSRQNRNRPRSIVGVNHAG